MTTPIIDALQFVAVEDVSLGWSKATASFLNGYTATVLKNTQQGIYSLLLPSDSVNAIAGEELYPGLTIQEAEDILQQLKDV